MIQAQFTTPTEIPTKQAAGVAEHLFGAETYNGGPIWMTGQNLIFSFAERMCPDYSGGQWQFWKTNNGTYFMTPDMAGRVSIQSENGFEGKVTKEAAGIIITMFALSHLSFTGVNETMSISYHKLYEYALDHPESASIFAAID